MATRDTIVIGASAGGVQARYKLVSALPPNLPAAVFIVLHIPSKAPSLLPEILSRDVGEMEQIGPLLYDILKGVDIPEQEKIEDPLRDLLAQVSAQTNINFRNYKSSTILRRISRRMAVTHNAHCSKSCLTSLLIPGSNHMVTCFG